MQAVTLLRLLRSRRAGRLLRNRGRGACPRPPRRFRRWPRGPRSSNERVRWNRSAVTDRTGHRRESTYVVDYVVRGALPESATAEVIERGEWIVEHGRDSFTERTPRLPPRCWAACVARLGEAHSGGRSRLVSACVGVAEVEVRH